MHKCTHLSIQIHMYSMSRNAITYYKGLKCVKHALTNRKEGLSYVFFKALIIDLDL